jgi:hypothetical protein
MNRFLLRCAQRLRFIGPMAVLLLIGVTPTPAQINDYEFNDSHFHLTNNIQEGPNIRDFLTMMGNTTGRVALFGIPLQQQWSYRIDGNRAPTYYLHTDAPLYYYSFTDTWIAMAYKSLTHEQQARFDPMITGFNPTDMYAADHIRRVLQTFPGVFTGIGEFTIHKEFVSAKIAGLGRSRQIYRGQPGCDKANRRADAAPPRSFSVWHGCGCADGRFPVSEGLLSIRPVVAIT